MIWGFERRMRREEILFVDQIEHQGYERLEHTDERRSHPSKRSYGTRFWVLEPKYRSWNQNTGPMIDTKRLKVVDMIGNESEYGEDSNII